MSGHESSEERELVDRLEASLNPQNSPVPELMDLAAMYIEPCHREEDAMRIFKSILRRDPDNNQAKFWLAYCLVHYKMDSEALDRAKALLGEIISADTKAAGAAYYLLTEVLEDLGASTPDQNIQLLELSVKHEPGWVHNRVSLAWAYWKKGRKSEAIAEMRAAIGNVAQAEPEWGATRKVYEATVTGRSAVRRYLEQDLARMLLETT